MMTDTTHELLTRLSTITSEHELILRNLVHLQRLEPAFTARALELLNQPNEKGVKLVRAWLRSVVKQKTLNEATKQAIKSEAKTGRSTTAADYTLRSITTAYAAHTVPDLPTSVVPIIQAEVRYHDEALQRDHMSLVPALTDELPVLLRYYRLLAAVAVLDQQSENYTSTPSDGLADFITWAMPQENQSVLLTTVQRKLTLNTTHLEAFLAQQKTTPQPLHEGLL